MDKLNLAFECSVNLYGSKTILEQVPKAPYKFECSVNLYGSKT